MHIQRRTLVYALCALALYFGWQALGRSAIEVATLYAPGVGTDDHYTRIWVVEDRPYTWIRAERPTRSWLPAVRSNPNVTLTRHGQRVNYLATVNEDPEAVVFVDELFRKKYGLADTAREIFTRRQSVPIRLEPK
jgi:hypothetical protein